MIAAQNPGIITISEKDLSHENSIKQKQNNFNAGRHLYFKEL